MSRRRSASAPTKKGNKLFNTKPHLSPLMKKIFLASILFAFFAVTSTATRAADAPTTNAPTPTLEQRVAGLEAYLANGDPTAPPTRPLFSSVARQRARAAGVASGMSPSQSAPQARRFTAVRSRRRMLHVVEGLGRQPHPRARRAAVREEIAGLLEGPLRGARHARGEQTDRPA